MRGRGPRPPALAAEAHVEHPAGAERDLGLARPHAALAEQRRLLVADEGGDRGLRRAAADALPTMPDGSTSPGSIASGMSQGVEDVLRPNPTRRRGGGR